MYFVVLLTLLLHGSEEEISERDSGGEGSDHGTTSEKVDKKDSTNQEQERNDADDVD